MWIWGTGSIARAGRTSTCPRPRCCTTRATRPGVTPPAIWPPTTAVPTLFWPIGTPPPGRRPYGGRSGARWRYVRAWWSVILGGNRRKGGVEVTNPAEVDAVILVGGQGTRLRPLTLSAPKPMLPTAGLPFL